MVVVVAMEMEMEGGGVGGGGGGGWADKSVHESAKTSRLITSREVQIIDSGWQRNGRIHKKKTRRRRRSSSSAGRIHKSPPSGYNNVNPKRVCAADQNMVTIQVRHNPNVIIVKEQRNVSI